MQLACAPSLAMICLLLVHPLKAASLSTATALQCLMTPSPLATRSRLKPLPITWLGMARKGLITAGRAITGADLPPATASTTGVVIPGTGLAVLANGTLNHSNAVTRWLQRQSII